MELVGFPMGCGPYKAFQLIQEVIGRAESGAGGRQRLVISRADVCLLGSLWLVVVALADGCPESAGASHLASGPDGCVCGNGLGR